MTQSARAHYIEFDEQTDVVVTLNACLTFACRVSSVPEFWKFVILTMQSAVQGACVCHLSGTAQLGALDEKSAKAQIAWHERDRGGLIPADNVDDPTFGNVRHMTRLEDAFPPSRMASPGELLRRVKGEVDRIETAGAEINVSPEQQEAFDKLNNFRHEFTHFKPRGWSIEISGLPNICLLCLEIIEAITTDGWAFRHLEVQERAELKGHISDLTSLFLEMK